jgi:hypothetical protein
MVLSQDDILELVAYLVTSARGLLDEPVDYGPMRLLTAAQRVCAQAAPRVDDLALRALLEQLAGGLPRDVARRISDPEGYRRALDEYCGAVAAALMRRAGRPVDR